jgi:Arc/MetJ family transcription regulator
MRTNIVIDDDLLKEAFQVSAARTKKELIHEALRVLIAFKKRKDLTDLAGKIDLRGDYDHKALRKLSANRAGKRRIAPSL